MPESPSRFVAILLLVALLGFACRGEGDEPSRLGNIEPVATSTVPVAALETPVPTPVDWKELFDQERAGRVSTPPPAETTAFPPVRLEVMFGGQTFERMTGLYEDSTGAWYVTEQPGRVHRFSTQDDEAILWLDLTERVDDDNNEKGFGGFALAQDFETSGIFYVAYSRPTTSVLSRIRARDGEADPSSEERLITLGQPGKLHNFGQLVFGPDGYLYLGSGDGGLPADFLGLSLNLDTLYGKILRLDVSDIDGPYAIPSDNPFIGVAGTKGETWAFGFRNPWRFSFDSATGDLWVGDVGEAKREEIDRVQRGGNYGWPIMEGSGCQLAVAMCRNEGLPPVYDYPHGERACAVIGGFVYRGSAIPGLQGAYVFTDLCSGAISALRVEDGVVTIGELARTRMLISSLAEGADGELYVLQLATKGHIFKLVP